MFLDGMCVAPLHFEGLKHKFGNHFFGWNSTAISSIYCEKRQMFLIGPSVSLLHFGQVRDHRCENDDIVFWPCLCRQMLHNGPFIAVVHFWCWKDKVQWERHKKCQNRFSAV